MAQLVSNLPAMQETQRTWLLSLVWEGPLEEGMATHPSILAEKIPGTEDPGSPWGHKELDKTEATENTQPFQYKPSNRAAVSSEGLTGRWSASRLPHETVGASSPHWLLAGILAFHFMGHSIGWLSVFMTGHLASPIPCQLSDWWLLFLALWASPANSVQYSNWLPQESSEKREREKESSSEKVKVLAAQSCPTLCDPMDCSLPGSSVHRILQARILEWVAISFPGGSSQPRDQTCISYVSCTGRQILYCLYPTREAVIPLSFIT